jgi:hypothetical protein
VSAIFRSRTAYRGLAIDKTEEVNRRGFKKGFALGEESACVGRRLVIVEGCPIPIQLVEDPLARLAVDQVSGIDEGSRLPVADAGHRLGHEGIDGQEEAARRRIEAALKMQESPEQ